MTSTEDSCENISSNAGSRDEKSASARPRKFVGHQNVPEKDYGFFRFKPSCFQCCNNAIGFLVFYSVFVITASTLSGGLLNINVSALERRFRLTSNQSALVVIGYDIGFCVLTIFVSYFGARSHRPRLVACGAFVFGLGAMFYALPHFISGIYNTGERRISLVCFDPSFDLDCSEVDDYLGWSVGVLFLGSLLMGFGLTPALTLGLAYIEDSVSKESSALFLGIANSAALVGPMIGFLGGGVLLRDYYVDFDKTPPPPGVNVSDPRWVGAWWVLPLVVMVGCWLFMIPLFGFPKQIPGRSVHQKKRESEVHKHGKSKIGSKKGFKNALRDFPRSFLILLRNPTFTMASIAGCLQTLIVNGIAAFMTKYIENSFHESVGNAALLTGAVIVPAGVVGTLIGGLIVYKFKWSIVGCLRCAAGCMLLAACLGPHFLLSCENRRVAGVTSPYNFPPNLSTSASQLESSCNSGCACQEEFYIASCAPDGLEYFSPCHASCANVISQTPLAYGPCSCSNSSVTLGSCQVDCTTKVAFLILNFISVFAIFAAVTPALISTFRVVPEQMRSFAVGVQFIFFRLLGAIPGPVLYGTFIDRSCLQWQTRQCNGTRGSCWIYDSKDMALAFVLITMICEFLSAVAYFISAQVYQPAVSAKYKDDENKIENDEISTERNKNDLKLGIDNPSLSST